MVPVCWPPDLTLSMQLKVTACLFNEHGIIQCPKPFPLLSSACSLLLDPTTKMLQLQIPMNEAEHPRFCCISYFLDETLIWYSFKRKFVISHGLHSNSHPYELFYSLASHGYSLRRSGLHYKCLSQWK